MRGYGVKLWSVFQDLSQAQAIYGKRWETFMSNAGVLHRLRAAGCGDGGIFIPPHRADDEGNPDLEPGEQAWRTDGERQHRHDANAVAADAAAGFAQHGMGYFVLFSHKTKGTIRGYAPYPTEIRGMEQITALDPASS